MKIRTLFFTICLLSTTIVSAQLSFTKSDTPLGTEPGKCATSGDIDNDGDIDIIIGYYNRDYIDSNRLWINNGEGNFTLSSSFVGINTLLIKLADLNNDNYPDIILVGSAWGSGDKDNKILLNNKNGTFTNYEQKIDSGAAIIQLIDFNYDGFPDFNLGESVWLNDSMGSFINSGISVGVDEIRNFTLGDLNCDGKLDAVAALDQSGMGERTPCKVYFNDGSDNFILDNTQNISNSSTYKVLIEDMNGDGASDILVLNAHVNTAEPDEVWINNGQGIFSQSDILNINAVTTDARIMDIDNDGDMDIYTNYDDPWSNPVPQYFWLNDGNGSFTKTDVGIVALPGFEINDFNGDGKPDILVMTSAGNYIWFNNAISNVSSDRIPNIKIYPNPTQNTLQIDCPGLIHKKVSYKIIDLSGKTLQQGKLTGNTIDVSRISKGTYLLNLHINGEVLSEKIVINI